MRWKARWCKRMWSDLTFRRLTSTNDPAFAPAMRLYESSFPLHEQRLPESQRMIMNHPEYHFDVIFDGGTFVGDMLYWRTDLFAYVEHFCIEPNLRGLHYGQSALKALCMQRGSVILEIDPPIDEISIRRKGFYVRCGFKENLFKHVHPPYREGNQGHELVIMSWPHELSKATYGKFNWYLQKEVMGQ